MTNDTRAGRRGLLKAIVGGAVGCGALAVPATQFVLAPASGGAGSGKWVKTLRFDALGDGEQKRITLIADRRDAWTLEKQTELGAVWLERRGDAVRAWSVTCPHLGCAVEKNAVAPGFYCPCHDSAFDPDGKRMTGPSPRDLDALGTRVEDGFVMVEFRRFRQGIPQKDPIG